MLLFWVVSAIRKAYSRGKECLRNIDEFIAVLENLIEQQIAVLNQDDYGVMIKLVP